MSAHQQGVFSPRVAGQRSHSSGAAATTESSSHVRRAGLKRVSTLKLLPSRVMSRLYGAVNTVPLPRGARPFVYGTWAWVFSANLEEAEQPLHEYRHLTAFFSRRLRHGLRPVDQLSPLVSPVDGRVVSTSSDLRQAGVLSQVKGIDYHVADFLGIPTPAPKPGHALFSCVLYLSPGDYHRFHSSCEWTVERRTHFAGQLLPVNPLLAHLLPSLFCTNERVALYGTWPHGFFSYTAVGATNVGSIRIAFDPDLTTNTYRHDWHCGFSALDAVGLSQRPEGAGGGSSHRASLEYPAPVALQRGEDVGHFELGSTVVLIFEAPLEFQWTIAPGGRVAVGKPLALPLAPGPACSPALPASEPLLAEPSSSLLLGGTGPVEAAGPLAFDSPSLAGTSGPASPVSNNSTTTDCYCDPSVLLLPPTDGASTGGSSTEDGCGGGYGGALEVLPAAPEIGSMLFAFQADKPTAVRRRGSSGPLGSCDLQLGGVGEDGECRAGGAGEARRPVPTRSRSLSCNGAPIGWAGFPEEAAAAGVGAKATAPPPAAAGAGAMHGQWRRPGFPLVVPVSDPVGLFCLESGPGLASPRCGAVGAVAALRPTPRARLCSTGSFMSCVDCPEPYCSATDVGAVPDWMITGLGADDDEEEELDLVGEGGTLWFPPRVELTFHSASEPTFIR